MCARVRNDAGSGLTTIQDGSDECDSKTEKMTILNAHVECKNS